MNGPTPTTPIPEIPQRLTDPRPVLAAGTLLWALASAVVWTAGDRWADARPICLMGMAVGALGYSIFRLQRQAARRGAKGAQTGLIP